MKRILICSAAVLGLAALAPAANAADLEGAITITGSVQAKCTAGAGFTDSYAIPSDMSAANGELDSGLSGSDASSPVFTKTFTIDCTGANAGVSVEATALVLDSSPGAPSGYSDTVNFTGRASFDLVSPSAADSTLDVDDDSSVSGATSDSFGAANFLANTSDNVRVSAFAFDAGTSKQLMAGDYSGKIVVTITPS